MVAGFSGRAVKGAGLGAACLLVFEGSNPAVGNGYLSVVSAVCCQVEVSATG